MRTSAALRSVRGFLIAIGCVALWGCASPAVTTTPTAPPKTASPISEPVDGGTITLTDDGCTWDDNPGTLRGAQATIELVNETDDYAVFTVHRLKPEFTWDDGVDAIEAIQIALAAGEPWPNWATSVSIGEADGVAEAGDSGEVLVPATSGTRGVVCSANTSATGDVLTIFLAGPLEVAAP